MSQHPPVGLVARLRVEVDPRLDEVVPLPRAVVRVVTPVVEVVPRPEYEEGVGGVVTPVAGVPPPHDEGAEGGAGEDGTVREDL
ncbi:hypothetical protein THAOC_06768, partial [Thalassiosira oceanica]